MYNVLLQCRLQFKGCMVPKKLLVSFHVFKFVMVNGSWPAMLKFINISDIMHHIEDNYVNSHRNYTMNLTCG